MTAEEARERFVDVAKAVRDHLGGERCPEDGELIVMAIDVHKAVDQFERWLEIAASEEAIGGRSEHQHTWTRFLDTVGLADR